MKKRIFLFTFFSLLLIINAIGLYLNYFSNEDVVLESASLPEKKKNNALTMMLETDVDSNEYEVATSNEWPQEGYIFNAEMSACERGGKLSWDSENNRVLMATSSADKCYVYFDRYTTVSITNVTTSNITNNSITLTIEATAGENSIATYYFSNDDGVSYEESDSNTYTFNNLEQGVEYNFRVYAVDTNGISSNIYSLSESTTSAIYFANYIKNTVYTGDGNNGLYYHDGVGTYGLYEAGDNSYRYSGVNPNNYVCFGSDVATCPSDNLYRIIGVFDNQVKLVKNGMYGYYMWCGSCSNTNTLNQWSQSTLNTEVLNGTYLNSFEAKWQDMIDVVNWQIGGNTEDNFLENNAKNAYINEIISPAENIIYSAKIGMIYINDFSYAASANYWTFLLKNYGNARNNNWLNSSYVYTITKDYGSSRNVFDTGGNGYVRSIIPNGGVSEQNGHPIKPTFYLNSAVEYLSGNGSSSSPYRIDLEN